MNRPKLLLLFLLIALFVATLINCISYLIVGELILEAFPIACISILAIASFALYVLLPLLNDILNDK